MVSAMEQGTGDGVLSWDMKANTQRTGATPIM
jgi:hypothetical protein